MQMLSLSAMAERSGRIFEVFNASNGLADNSAQVIKCTRTGRIVTATMGQINFFDGQQFTFIDPTEENVYPLENYRGNYHLYFDKYHHLWLKNRQTVTCVNLTTEKFVTSVKDEFLKFGFSKTVDDLFVGDDGVVWLLNGYDLFSVASQKTYRIRAGKNLQDVETYRDKTLLLFYDDGLVEAKDLATGKSQFQLNAYDDSQKERYKSSSVLYKDSDYIYQIRNGEQEAILMRLDVDKREMVTIFQHDYHLNNIAKRDSLFYIPTSYGYMTYSPKSGSMHFYDELVLLNGRELQTDINVIAFDKQGGMWAGTERRGLLYSRPFNVPFRSYGWDDPRSRELYMVMERYRTSVSTFHDQYVNCAFRDSRGWMWVGTNHGLQLYRNESDKLPQMITCRDGMLNDVVHSITEDLDHQIWVGTSYGVSCVVLKGNDVDLVASYNAYDLVPPEAFANNGAACTPEGMVVMQMLDHMLTFNPREMRTINGAMRFEIFPKLIRLFVNGNELKAGDELDGKVIIEKAVSRLQEINVNYDQNTLTLMFSALNYFRPQHTYYRVRVTGLDDQWHIYSSFEPNALVDKSGRLRLQLMALNPGTYEIEIQASMNPKDWTTTPYKWIINVNEPWWRSTGVYWLLALILLVLVAVNAYYYLRNDRMFTMRDTQERPLLKNIRRFAERCTTRGTEPLEPSIDEIHGRYNDNQMGLAPEFIKMMINLMPYVMSKPEDSLTMRELGRESGLEIQEFYKLITGNIYKSPRPMALSMMMEKGIEMLRTTDKSIEEIASELGFVSPNYFVATFYQMMKKTPDEYRQRHTVKSVVKDYRKKKNS
jgi:AraC-like DNA-binding protein